MHADSTYIHTSIHLSIYRGGRKRQWTSSSSACFHHRLIYVYIHSLTLSLSLHARPLHNMPSMTVHPSRSVILQTTARSSLCLLETPLPSSCALGTSTAEKIEDGSNDTIGGVSLLHSSLKPRQGPVIDIYRVSSRLSVPPIEPITIRTIASHLSLSSSSIINATRASNHRL
jgi:hypothetical protein